jgi:hypothetical protein
MRSVLFPTKTLPPRPAAGRMTAPITRNGRVIRRPTSCRGRRRRCQAYRFPRLTSFSGKRQHKQEATLTGGLLLPLPVGQITSLYQNQLSSSQALSRKIFLFRFSEKCDCLRIVPLPQEGRTRRHERWVRDAMDAFGSQDERCRCGRRNRVVLIPRRWDQAVPGRFGAATVASKPGTPRRARISRNTIRAGNAGLPPLNLYARVRIFACILHTGPRVQRAPGIPCAL